MNLEKYNNIRDRALKSSDPDEVAKIMDEMEPWDYPALGLYELVMHLRAALYKNIAHMFLGIELTFGSEDVKIVGEITKHADMACILRGRNGYLRTKAFFTHH